MFSHLFTPGKMFAFCAFLLGAVQALASLNHSTTGHLFLWLAFGAVAVSIILLIREHKTAERVQQETKSLNQSLTISTVRIEPPHPEKSELASERITGTGVTTPANNPGRTKSWDDRWPEYKRDVFDGVIWVWHYKPEFGNTPLGLTAYCPECERSEQIKETALWGGGAAFLCSGCNRDFDLPNDVEIKQQIKKKLADGSWRYVVSKQEAI